MKYLVRSVDRLLDELSPELAAIALEGPRGVGKTLTASRRVARTLRLDDSADRALVQATPGLIADAIPGALLLDEWQRLPEVWDYVRRAVDEDSRGGRFLLTGSATPPQLPSHSGAGRIVTVRMRPMSLVERGAAEPSVSLADLMTGQRPDVAGHTDLNLTHYAAQIVASGLPAINRLGEQARTRQLASYLARISERDFIDLDYRVRQPETLMRWLRAYAAAESTTTAYTKLLVAASAGDGTQANRATVTAYRDLLSRLWLLDPVPAWQPDGHPLSTLAKSPKLHLADPAFSAALLGVTERSLMRSASDLGHAHLLGPLFEALATLCLRVEADVQQWDVRHLRTAAGGREIDLILRRADGRVLAVEVKLTAAPGDRDVTHLNWLAERWPDGVLDRVIITTGQHAYRRQDGVAVVPLALLGP